jgi:hypothetical protein
MHYSDLELCYYHSGAFDADEWKVPLLAVGWLDQAFEYPIGFTPPEFAERVAEFVAAFRPHYPSYYFRGMYNCTLCEASKRPGPGGIWSQENILVPGDGVVYISPGGITHYITSHDYRPPAGFYRGRYEVPGPWIN